MTKIDFMKKAIDLSIQNIKDSGGPFWMCNSQR